MRKYTAEEENIDKCYEEYVKEKLQEAEEDIKNGRVLTEEEFDTWLEEYEREYEENQIIIKKVSIK